MLLVPAPVPALLPGPSLSWLGRLRRLHTLNNGRQQRHERGPQGAARHGVGYPMLKR
jgi:hypothetical protein